MENNSIYGINRIVHHNLVRFYVRTNGGPPDYSDPLAISFNRMMDADIDRLNAERAAMEAILATHTSHHDIH